MNKTCTCKPQVKSWESQEHETRCPLWVPLWVRVRREKVAKHGIVAEHGLDRS